LEPVYWGDDSAGLLISAAVLWPNPGAVCVTTGAYDGVGFDRLDPNCCEQDDWLLAERLA